MPRSTSARVAAYAGRYHLDRVLGRGPSGVVYAARDTFTRQACVLKRIHPLYHEEPVLRRVAEDARAAGRVVHPAILAPYDSGFDEDGALYLASEPMAGESLRSRLCRGPLSLPEVLELLGALTPAIEEAHRAGLAHGDLTPSNVILPEAGGGPRIVDFGMRHLLAAAGGLWIGTPGYVPPEVYRGEDPVPGVRADVFALGALVFECLTGRRLFEGPSSAAVMYKVCVSPLPALGPQLPADRPRLEAVLRMACDKDPLARFATPLAFWRALLAVIGDGPRSDKSDPGQSLHRPRQRPQAMPAPAPMLSVLPLTPPEMPAVPLSANSSRDALASRPPGRAGSLPPQAPGSGLPSRPPVERASLPPRAAEVSRPPQEGASASLPPRAAGAASLPPRAVEPASQSRPPASAASLPPPAADNGPPSRPPTSAAVPPRAADNGPPSRPPVDASTASPLPAASAASRPPVHASATSTAPLPGEPDPEARARPAGDPAPDLDDGDDAQDDDDGRWQDTGAFSGVARTRRRAFVGVAAGALLGGIIWLAVGRGPVRPPLPVPTPRAPDAARQQPDPGPPAALLLQAEARLGAHDPAAALALCERLKERWPTDARVGLLYGQAKAALHAATLAQDLERAVQRGDAEAAVSLYRELPKDAPQFEQAQRSLAPLRRGFERAHLELAATAARHGDCDEVARQAEQVGLLREEGHTEAAERAERILARCRSGRREPAAIKKGEPPLRDPFSERRR